MNEKKMLLESGKIVNTHGIKGEVKIQPWADSPSFLLDFKRLFIDDVEIEISASRVHKTCVIAKLAGIDDVSAAMRLKGKTVFIHRGDVDLPEGDFFIQDIIGATVKDEDGKELGKLTEVLDLPSSQVYVVKGEREILIPAVPAFILDTDIENKLITVHLIEGI